MGKVLEFAGFEARNTPVPDAVFDYWLSILSGSELKVLLYIVRRTLGFGKVSDAISFTQFERGITTSEGKVLDKGCGLHRETISLALRTLEEKGCIKSQKSGTGHRNKDGVTIYTILIGSALRPRSQGRDTQTPKSSLSNARLEELRTMSYPDYLLTPEWQEKRKKALRFAGFRCQLCNSSERLNVHHRTYERLGCELLGDLFTLCNDCHAIFHQNGQLEGDK
jgi:hypothetical protein